MMYGDSIRLVKNVAGGETRHTLMCASRKKYYNSIFLSSKTTTLISSSFVRVVSSMINFLCMSTASTVVVHSLI